MDCGEARERLQDHLDERLTKSESEALERHLADCDACASEREALVATVGLVRDLPREAVPAGFAGDVLDRLDRPRGRRLELPLAALGIAAAAAVLLIAVIVFHPGAPTAPLVETEVADSKSSRPVELDKANDEFPEMAEGAAKLEIPDEAGDPEPQAVAERIADARDADGGVLAEAEAKRRAKKDAWLLRVQTGDPGRLAARIVAVVGDVERRSVARLESDEALPRAPRRSFGEKETPGVGDEPVADAGGGRPEAGRGGGVSREEARLGKADPRHDDLGTGGARKEREPASREEIEITLTPDQTKRLLVALSRSRRARAEERDDAEASPPGATPADRPAPDPVRPEEAAEERLRGRWSVRPEDERRLREMLAWYGDRLTERPLRLRLFREAAAPAAAAPAPSAPAGGR